MDLSKICQSLCARTLHGYRAPMRRLLPPPKTRASWASRTRGLGTNMQASEFVDNVFQDHLKAGYSMSVANSRVTRMYLPVALCILLNPSAVPLASGQSTSDFAVSSPQPVVQLVGVQRLLSKNLSFTFRNISNKTILDICISAERGPKEMVCKAGFANAATLPGPGQNLSMSFDARGFAADTQSGTLKVDAVIYTDGSHFGDRAVLANAASQMIGDALETNRISNLLSDGSDESVAGLDSILPQIGTRPPSSGAEAAETLKGVSLPGISQSLVNSHLATPDQNFLQGVLLARNAAIRDISQKKTMASLPITGSQNKQQAILEAKLHGRTDLAHKYQALNQSQVNYLVSLMRGRDVQ